MGTVRLRQWPGRVIPATEEETQAAITALFARAGWNEPITDEVVDELQKWFDTDWCVDAILVALDRKPDNTTQRPRGGREQDLAKYLRNRLAVWFNNRDDATDATTRLPPPRPGMNMGTWWRINQRNRYTNQPRRPRPLGRDGEQARQHARERAGSRRRDPIERNRESDARLRAAMDQLLPPGATAADADPLVQLDDTPIHPRHRLVAGYAGRRAVIHNDPTIRTILTIVRQQRRRPTTAELAILRNALRGARASASLAELEALTADTAGEILSHQALQILRYYDHALAEDLSLDSMIAMLTAMVDDEHAADHANSARTRRNPPPQHWRTAMSSTDALGGSLWGSAVEPSG